MQILCKLYHVIFWVKTDWCRNNTNLVGKGIIPLEDWLSLVATEILLLPLHLSLLTVLQCWHASWFLCLNFSWDSKLYIICEFGRKLLYEDFFFLAERRAVRERLSSFSSNDLEINFVSFLSSFCRKLKSRVNSSDFSIIIKLQHVFKPFLFKDTTLFLFFNQVSKINSA